MANNIITVSHLSKAYKLYPSKSDRLKEALSLTRKSYHSDYYALNDISFEVEKGDTVGIIGTNGSGKSTLLKILTGVTAPTAGSVQVNGRISALLELGAGFNPEYSGLENIALNGAMLGYSPAEMEARQQDIVRFADIGEYINQPVKTYSSGMFARLAFATAINVEPEILIVDEVLSVGDTRFQIKCMDKMKAMMEDGTTILYVSHDISSVRRFCNKCLWINKGVLQAAGETNHICDLYSNFLNLLDSEAAEVMKHEEVAEQGADDSLPPFKDAGNGQLAEIMDLRIGRVNNSSTDIYFDEPLTITVVYDVYDVSVPEPVLGVALFSIDGRYICGLNTLLDHETIPWKYGRNSFSIRYPQGLRALGGSYFFDATLRDKTATVNLDYKRNMKDIVINSGYIAEGLFVIPHAWGLSTSC